jgi:hypothetical protein
LRIKGQHNQHRASGFGKEGKKVAKEDEWVPWYQASQTKKALTHPWGLPALRGAGRF